MERVILPDGSQADLDPFTLQFFARKPGEAVQSAGPEDRTEPWEGVDIPLLIECLQQPKRRYGDCFSVIVPGRYHAIQARYPIDLNIVHAFYKLGGSRRGGTFSSSDVTLKFLDGGIDRHSGYGFGSHSWIVLVGYHALRAVCCLHGVIQPRWVKGEPERRPLSELLAELSTFPRPEPNTMAIEFPWKDPELTWDRYWASKRARE